MKLGDLIQSGDWKGEKHVPVIVAPAAVKAGESVSVELSVGKEIPHPNTDAHHIAWIKLFYKAAGSKFAVELESKNFDVHGEGAPAPLFVANVTLPESGTLIALSYCNLHGLWESSAEVAVEA